MSAHRAAREPLRVPLQRFWFQPADVTPLAVFRIAFGLLSVAWTLALLPDLRPFFTDRGIIGPAPSFPISVFALSSALPVVVGLWALLLVASVCLAVGLGTRVAALVVWLLMLSFERRNPLVFNAGDVVLRIEALLLVFAPSGAALSLDRWLRHRDRFWEFPRRSPWVLRLLQLQMCAIYLFTVWDKVQGSRWNNGTAVAYAFQVGDLVRVPTPSWILHSVLLVNLLTYGTLALELSLALLVWNRRLRPWVLAGGVLMHLSIDVTILVGLFSWVMIATYLTFVPPETMSRFVLRLRDLRGRPRSEQPDIGVPEPLSPQPQGAGHLVA